jgi:LmbE family N-acetylglucosaminyl deacetylase
MKSKPHRLLVVAHPDDETIFFGGLLLRKQSLPWRVICVTDGNADGRGKERAKEFQKACRLIARTKGEQWNYPDRFPDRLPVAELCARLQSGPLPQEIYTHGPLGEYGHPHHQDVCLAVHRAFPQRKIFSPAWNVKPDFSLQLTAKEAKVKTKVFGEVYRKETDRFLNILPLSLVESYVRFENHEVESIVPFMRGEGKIDSKKIVRHLWLAKKLPELRNRWATRLL